MKKNFVAINVRPMCKCCCLVHGNIHHVTAEPHRLNDDLTDVDYLVTCFTCESAMIETNKLLRLVSLLDPCSLFFKANIIIPHPFPTSSYIPSCPDSLCHLGNLLTLVSPYIDNLTHFSKRFCGKVSSNAPVEWFVVVSQFSVPCSQMCVCWSAPCSSLICFAEQ